MRELESALDERNEAARDVFGLGDVDTPAPDRRAVDQSQINACGNRWRAAIERISEKSGLVIAAVLELACYEGHERNIDEYRSQLTKASPEVLLSMVARRIQTAVETDRGVAGGSGIEPKPARVALGLILRRVERDEVTLTHRQICQALDAEHIETPRNCPTWRSMKWVEAYDDPDKRSAVSRWISIYGPKRK